MYNRIGLTGILTLCYTNWRISALRNGSLRLISRPKLLNFFLCKNLEIYDPKKSIANLVDKLNLVDRVPVTKAVH